MHLVSNRALSCIKGKMALTSIQKATGSSDVNILLHLQRILECIKEAKATYMILLSSSLKGALKVLDSSYGCMERMKHELRATIQGIGYLNMR